MPVSELGRRSVTGQPGAAACGPAPPPPALLLSDVAALQTRPPSGPGHRADGTDGQRAALDLIVSGPHPYISAHVANAP